jgi:ankyrin repeat protein
VHSRFSTTDRSDGAQPLHSARRRRIARAALALVQTGAAVWFRPDAPGFPLDDAWIHQVVARTLSTTGTLGMTPGEHGAGATSWLWALVSAANLAWLGVDPVTFCFVLNLALHVAAGQLAYALFVRWRPSCIEAHSWDWSCAAATALGFCSGNALWFVSSGMEADAFVVLSLFAIWAVTHSQPHALSAGVAAALAALLRPDAMLLGALLVFHTRHRSRAFRLRVALPWAVATAGYFLVNVIATGRPSPATFGARRWMWLDGMQGASMVDLAVSFCDQWLLRLRSWVFASSIAIEWVALGLAAYAVVRLARRANEGGRLLLVWCVVHLALFAVVLPVPGHGGRYQPLLPILFSSLVALGTVLVAWGATRPLASKARLDVLALGLVLWAPAFARGAREMKRANELATRHIERTEFGAARFASGLDPEAVLASFDIGAVAWIANRPIVDLGGLGGAAAASVLERGWTWELLRQRNVAFVILPEEQRPELPSAFDFRSRLLLRDNPIVKLDPVFRIATPDAEWARGVAATANAAAAQVVYAVTYADGPPPRSVEPSSVRRDLLSAGPGVRDRDRRILERMLAALDASGLSVKLAIDVPLEGQPPCAIALDLSGLTLTECRALGQRAAAEAAIVEMALPWIDAGDLGGAGRAALHALARVRQRLDPAFSPRLAPLSPLRPGGGELAVVTTAAWGVPLLFLVVAVGSGLAFVRRPPRRVEVALAAVFVVACGATSAPEAAVEGRAAVLEALASGAAIDERDASGRTALAVAAEVGDVDAVIALLERGASADLAAPDGSTPLHRAVRERHLACVRALLPATSARDAVAGLRRRAALHDAVLGGDEDVVKALLSAGVDPGASDTFGATPLHLLAGKPAAWRIAPLLLRAGARPDARDRRGFTVLHAAAAVDDVSLLRAVLPSVDVDVLSTRNETALDVALRYRADRAAEVLLAAGAVAHAAPPLHQAARMRDLGRARALVEAGADVSRVYEGETPLEIAKTRGDAAMVELLSSAARR